MSAYIVQDETINRIVSFLHDLEFQNESPLMYLRPYWPRMSDEQCVELATKLYNLNASAVGQRYPNSVAEPVEAFPFRYTLKTTDIQMLKHLDCFLYQCSEGDVPEQDLFQKLDDVRTALARILITSTPEYNAAAWA